MHWLDYEQVSRWLHKVKKISFQYAARQPFRHLISIQRNFVRQLVFPFHRIDECMIGDTYLGHIKQ